MLRFKRLSLLQTLSWLVVASSFVFVGALSIQAVSNADAWFHLKVGELLLETRSFPHQDVMSHTAYGRELTAPSWLYSVVAQSLAARWGLNSISFLRLFSALAAMLIAIKTGRLLGSPPSVTAPIFALAFWAISIAWMDRPHIFGYLFISFTVYALVAYLQRPTRLIWWIPLITIPWANTHASVPFVMVLVGLFMAATWVGSYFFREEVVTASRRRAYRELLIIFGLCFGASLINPYGLKMYEYFFKITPTAKGNIFEWLPLANFFGDSYIRHFTVLLLTTLLALVFSAITSPRSVRLWEVCLTGVLTWMSLSALRHVVIFAFVLVPYLAKNVTTLVTWALKKRPRLRTNTLLIVYRLVVLATVVVFSIQPVGNIIRGVWGVSFAMLPLEAAEFIDKTNIEGKMYNHFNWGGYLIWKFYPRYLTFIDGRLDMFVPDIYQDWLVPASGGDGWEDVFIKYGVDWIIFPSPGIWDGLKDSYGEDKEWALVYWDDVASIFVKRGGGNEAIIQRYEYAAITPFDPILPSSSEGAQAAVGEYQRVITQSPTSSLTARNKLGVLYSALGKDEAAQKSFQEALDIDPHYAAVAFNLGVLYERRQEYDRAVAFYSQAIDSDAAFAQAYQKLARLYAYQKGDYVRGVRYLRKYYDLSTDEENRYFTVLEIQNMERGVETLQMRLDK